MIDTTTKSGCACCLLAAVFGAAGVVVWTVFLLCAPVPYLVGQHTGVWEPLGRDGRTFYPGYMIPLALIGHYRRTSFAAAIRAGARPGQGADLHEEGLRLVEFGEAALSFEWLSHPPSRAHQWREVLANGYFGGPPMRWWWGHRQEGALAVDARLPTEAHSHPAPLPGTTGTVSPGWIGLILGGGILAVALWGGLQRWGRAAPWMLLAGSLSLGIWYGLAWYALPPFAWLAAVGMVWAAATSLLLFAGGIGTAVWLLRSAVSTAPLAGTTEASGSIS